jgi:hypothetical protein
MARRAYRYERVLIDASRVLDSQYPDLTLNVTGAQLEMLRNVTQYLNRETTYANEWFSDYYNTPDTVDMDTISAIVADLELELMGGMNVIFGYNDVYQEYRYDLDASSGIIDLDFGQVPSGQIWIVLQWSARNEDTKNNNTLLRIETLADFFNVATAPPDFIDHLVGTSVHVVIQELQHLQIRFEGCNVNDVLRGWVSGYKMVV